MKRVEGIVPTKYPVVTLSQAFVDFFVLTFPKVVNNLKYRNSDTVWTGLVQYFFDLALKPSDYKRVSPIIARAPEDSQY